MPRKVSNPFETYRRLSPSELSRLGYSPKARRYVRKSTKTLTKKTATIAYRQYEQKRVKAERGENTTLEKIAKQRSQGKREYRSQRSESITKFQKQARKIRSEVDGITLKDIKLILRFREVGYHGLADENEDESLYDDDQEAFRQLFKKYSRTHMLPLVSPMTKVDRAA